MGYNMTSTDDWLADQTMNATVDYNITSTSYWTTNITTVRPRPRRVQLTTGYYGYARESLWKIVAPILISWGTIGNILTILVILRLVKRSSTSVYLLALAISDMVILYSGPLRNWIKFTWEKDIRYMTDAGCKIQLYLTYVSLHFSSWLLVAVTWERAISVLLPHKVRFCCTPIRAGVMTFAMLVIILCVDMFIAISFTLNGIGNLLCSPSNHEYREFRDLYWGWIDFSVVFAIPFVLLVIGNIIIIIQLRRSSQMKEVMKASYGGKKGKSGDTRSVSHLMVALCVIYLVTMTPVSAYQIYMPYSLNEILKLAKTKPLKAYRKYEFDLFLHTVFNLIGYTNAAFNFILYVFSGSKFRAELIGLFRCSKRASSTGGAFGTSKSSKPKTTSTAVKSGRVYSIGESNNVTH